MVASTLSCIHVAVTILTQHCTPLHYTWADATQRSIFLQMLGSEKSVEKRIIVFSRNSQGLLYLLYRFAVGFYSMSYLQYCEQPILFSNQSILLMYRYFFIVFSPMLISGGMLDCHGGWEAVKRVLIGVRILMTSAFNVQ